MLWKRVPPREREETFPRSDARGERAIGLLLTVGLFSFYLTAQYGRFLGWDGITMANLTHNIVDHHRLLVTPDVFWWVKEFPGNKSPFGIGMSLVFVPFWFVQGYVNPRSGFLLTLANPMITAGTAFVVYRIGVTLRWRRSVAVVTALSFGLLTMALNYTIDLWSEPAVGLCYATALLGLLQMAQRRRSGPWVVGTSTGVACLFRSDSSVLLLVPVFVILPLFVGRDRVRQEWLRWLIPLTGPAVLSAAWTLWYNWYRTGSAFNLVTGGPFSTPMRSGLHRQLISSGKGFFWYDPILIAAVPGLWWLWHRHRGVVVFVVGVFLLRAAFFARCWNPDGTVAWGPRYLVPACALLVLGWGELLERIRTMGHLGRDVARLVLGGLAVAGAVVSFASVWVPYTTTWAYVNDLRGLQQMPAAKLNAIVRDRISHQNNDWYWSPIVLNLRSSGHASRYDPPGFALLWWRGGPTVMGVLTLTAGIAGMGAAVTVAVVDDRRRADDGCATKPDQVRLAARQC